MVKKTSEKIQVKVVEEKTIKQTPSRVQKSKDAIYNVIRSNSVMTRNKGILVAHIKKQTHQTYMTLYKYLPVLVEEGKIQAIPYDKKTSKYILPKKEYDKITNNESFINNIKNRDLRVYC